MGGKALNPNDGRLRQNRQSPEVRKAVLAGKMRSILPSTTETNYVDPEARPGEVARTSHTAYGKVPLYRLTPAGSVRFRANEQSVNEMLQQPTISDACFDCGNNDCLAMTTIPGEVSTNQCPGAPPRASRICPHPECGKRVFDSKAVGAYLQEGFASKGEADDAVIEDDMYSTSTPASRTASAMKLHILTYHPQLAEELGYRRESALAPV
jgi:hypothetical protein